MACVRRVPEFAEGRSLSRAERVLLFLKGPRGKGGVVRMTKAGKGNSMYTCLSTVLETRKGDAKLFASPRLIGVGRQVILGKGRVDSRSFYRMFRRAVRTIHEVRSTKLRRPAFFRFLFTVTVGTCSETKVRCVILRAKLKNQLSTADSMRPITYIVASVNLSRVRCLNSAIRRVTKRGTKVVQPRIPIFFTRATPKDSSMVRGATRGRNYFYGGVKGSTCRVLKVRSGRVTFSYTDTCCKAAA